MIEKDQQKKLDPQIAAMEIDRKGLNLRLRALLSDIRAEREANRQEDKRLLSDLQDTTQELRSAASRMESKISRLKEIVRAKPPTRFDVIMPLDMAQDMQDLVDETGYGQCEIFRRAISLYKLAVETRSAGGNVILRDSDGTLRVINGIY